MIKLSTLQASLIALSLAGYPLVASLTTALGLEGSGVSMIMRALVLMLSIALLAPSFAIIKKAHLIYLAIFSLFWFVYMLRLLVDTSLYSEQLSRPASEYWLWAIGVCLLPVLALMGTSEDTATRKAFYVAWLMMSVAVALAIYFGSTIVTRLDGSESDTGRLALANLNPISSGHLGLSLMIFSGWYLYGICGQKRVLRMISFVGIVTGLYLLIISASRGPLVALVGVGLIILQMMEIRKAVKVLALIFLLLIVPLIFILKHIDLNTLGIIIRVVGSTTVEDLSVGIRQDSFFGAWQQFLANPFLGDLIEERGSGYYPHNLILEAFMATGIIGGMSLIAISIFAFMKSWMAIRAKAYNGWVGLIFIQYLIGAQFSGSLYASGTFWVFSALIIFADPIASNMARFLSVRMHPSRSIT